MALIEDGETLGFRHLAGAKLRKLPNLVAYPLVCLFLVSIGCQPGDAAQPIPLDAVEATERPATPAATPETVPATASPAALPGEKLPTGTVPVVQETPVPTEVSPRPPGTSPTPADEAELHFIEGRELFTQEQWEEAVREFTETLKFNPGHPLAHY